MVHKYSILQLVETGSPITRDKMFMPWDFVKNKFDINEYQKVYEGEIEGGNSEHFILEDLFSIFNVNHPEDFKGHSLSVSDVVELDGKLWYCDSYCWHKIEEEK